MRVPLGNAVPEMQRDMLGRAAHAYRLRWKRRRLLWRILRKRGEINALRNLTDRIRPDDILLFCCVRNEAPRLPHFMQHYRVLGIRHFIFVDNGSDDGTTEYLCEQPDVSVWRTDQSYRLSRFGMDWLGWLQMRFGHGHWCLTVDADELLVYPQSESRDLHALTAWLDTQGRQSFGALMIDLYPKGGLQDRPFIAGTNPLEHLQWFDPTGYRLCQHPVFGNHWVQGGPRARMFFKDDPERAPTLNKTPLVKWNRRFAYVSSTHQILPARLHDVFDFAGQSLASGALLHTKFLPQIAEKSQEELIRQQHFQNATSYADYHRQLADNPILWHHGSQTYQDTESLIPHKLIVGSTWSTE